MNKRSFLSLVVATGLVLFGCSRKGNNPVLGTPDPTVTSILTSIVDEDTSDLKNVRVTLSVITDAFEPLTGLVLGNIVIQEGLQYHADVPAANSVPVSLTESASVPGRYELTFQPRSLKGYLQDGEGTVFQIAWITVVYGNVSSQVILLFPTH